MGGSVCFGATSMSGNELCPGPQRLSLMQDMIQRARAFADQRHRGQRRKYEQLPYIIHLDRVADIIRRHDHGTPTMLAAAYLHDTVEDTATTIQEILEVFGPEVAQLVYWLTDAEQGKRKARKLMSAWRLSRAPIEAKLIKLADFVDNTPSIVEFDPSFARVYLAEKELILGEMVKVEGTGFQSLPLFAEASAAH